MIKVMCMHACINHRVFYDYSQYHLIIACVPEISVKKTAKRNLGGNMYGTLLPTHMVSMFN